MCCMLYYRCLFQFNLITIFFFCIGVCICGVLRLHTVQQPLGVRVLCRFQRRYFSFVIDTSSYTPVTPHHQITMF